MSTFLTSVQQVQYPRKNFWVAAAVPVFLLAGCHSCHRTRSINAL